MRRKAEERLLSYSDVLVRELLKIATSAENEAVRLAAVRDALDRIGLGKNREIDIRVAPWLKDIEGIVVDIEDDEPSDVVDAEVVDDETDIPPSDWESRPTGDPDPPRYPRQDDSNVLAYPSDAQRHRWRR